MVMWKTRKRKHFPKKVSYTEFHGKSLHSRVDDDGLKIAIK